MLAFLTTMLLTKRVRALCTRSHPAGRAMRRCSSLRTEVRRVLSPCLARPAGYAQAHSTAVSRLNGGRKLAILDVLVQRAARQAGALLNLGAAKNSGLFRNLGVHVRQFLEVGESGPADMNVFELPWPCSRNTERLR